MEWTLISIVSSIICLLLFITFLILSSLFARAGRFKTYQHAYVNVTESWSKDSFNRIFTATDNLSEIIDKYIISYEKKNCFLVCKYVKQFTSIAMKIYTYDGNKELISVFNIKELGELISSSKIKLPINTMYINLVVNCIDGKKLIDPEEEKRKNKQYRTLMIVETLMLFFALVPISYITVKTVSGNLVYEYLNTIGLIISLALIIIICLINYGVIKKRLRKKLDSFGE